MRARYLLDTNTVSYILKRRPEAVTRRLNDVRASYEVCISSVTEAELRYGYVRAGAGPDRFRALDLFLSEIKVLPWGREEATVYANLRTEQERIGRSLGSLDTLIAAHAVATDAILVTHDTAMKSVTTLLGIEDWATDL